VFSRDFPPTSIDLRQKPSMCKGINATSELVFLIAVDLDTYLQPPWGLFNRGRLSEHMDQEMGVGHWQKGIGKCMNSLHQRQSGSRPSEHCSPTSSQEPHDA
jgi:hypothetical protein